MFQGIRKNFNLDFLDNKIAEEQEKQKKQQSQPLPSKRSSQRARTQLPDAQPDRANTKEPASKGPDPDSFVIGDDASDISRAATPSGSYRHASFNGVVIEPSTPAPKQDAETVSNTTTLAPGAKGKERATEVEQPPAPISAEIQLPQEVQQKLYKLEQLTPRYQDLLRNYRIAHKNVAAIEPFEAALREHTPLTSLDAAALIEFLNQRNLQSEMVLAELKRVTAEHSQDKKRLETLQSTLKSMQEQRNDAEESKKNVESQFDNMRLEINKLEGEVGTSAEIIARLRQTEASNNDLKRKLAAAEAERDSAQRVAESKKGHESAAASLRCQLKSAKKDRNNAYQAIIDCGKCSVPPPDEQKVITPSEESISTPSARSRLNSDVTEASTQPTEVTEPTTSAIPSVDGASELASPCDAKKKKKKSKSKKKKTPTSTGTAPDATRPDIAESIQQRIEELEQQIKDHPIILQQKNDQIKALEEAKNTIQTRLDGEAALKEQIAELKEECEDLKQDILEHGGAAADAKHALKESTERFQKLESERDELEKCYSEAKSTEAALKEQIAELKEERENLKQDILEHGGAAADAKHALKESTERSQKLEGERDELEKRYSEAKSSLKKNEQERAVLQEAYERTCKDLASSESARVKISDQCHEATMARDSLQSEVKRYHDLRDQTRELGVQLKERETRAESLEEELADAHRLLSERSREGETMRRLLSEAEARAEGKVTEMREQLDIAIAQRESAESEAGVAARRKRREIEDLKTKLRDAEREASLALEGKAIADRTNVAYMIRFSEIEDSSAELKEKILQSTTDMRELAETLRDTKDQLSKVEKKKAELHKTLEERDRRMEKLTNSARGMAEEMNRLKAANKAAGSATPSRTSNDSSRVTSPAPRPSTSGAQSHAVDSVYLKSVLLQFMEQKEKKHRLQLVPVLSQLLHMSKEEEQKWYASVQSSQFKW